MATRRNNRTEEHRDENGVKLRPLAAGDPRVADPMFTFREAAFYLEIPTSTLHHWAKPAAGLAPLITRLDEERPSIPFIGFAEAFVIRTAIRAGVPRRRVRPGVEAIKERAGDIQHALASRLVWTDGAEILWGIAGHDLEVARTNQKQFSEAVRNQLQLISYGNDGFAEYLTLPKYGSVPVTVDPFVAGGLPLIRSGIGIRVEDVAHRVQAGDPPEEVARSFRIPLEAVKEIIRKS
jgi:uncharacterized protein (DUF433 family)